MSEPALPSHTSPDTTPGVSAREAGGLMYFWSVRLPRVLDRWAPRLADSFADGAWLGLAIYGVRAAGLASCGFPNAVVVAGNEEHLFRVSCLSCFGRRRLYCERRLGRDAPGGIRFGRFLNYTPTRHGHRTAHGVSRARDWLGGWSCRGIRIACGIGDSNPAVRARPRRRGVAPHRTHVANRSASLAVR